MSKRKTESYLPEQVVRVNIGSVRNPLWKKGVVTEVMEHALKVMVFLPTQTIYNEYTAKELGNVVQSM